MKATGVVRRIDDLGRIVIPKEIRKTLRIKEGDPLEIFTEKDGDIILKKYSPIGELSNFATEYVESLNKITGHISIITDRDTVIAVAGTPKKDILEQKISSSLEKVFENRQKFISDGNNSILITEKGNREKEMNPQVIAPIISDGDVIGSVALIRKDSSLKMSKTEEEIVSVAAAFLGSQMEI